jgi:hypothetical protein
MGSTIRNKLLLISSFYKLPLYVQGEWDSPDLFDTSGPTGLMLFLDGM